MTTPVQPGPKRGNNTEQVGRHYTGPDRRRTITVLLATNRLELSNNYRPAVENYRVIDFATALVTSATQLLAAIERRSPRILLLDQRLLYNFDKRAAESICVKFPRLRVLLVCDRQEPDLVDQIVRNRFHGFLRSTAAPETCVKALFKVNRGEFWMPRALMEHALRMITHSMHGAGPTAEIETKLSKREAEAVRLLCCGLTNRQIADRLGIREDTVKKHLHKAYAKLGVENRSQLIATFAARSARDE